MRYLILFVSLLLIAGCSSPKPQLLDNPETEPIQQEVVSREAVYTYGSSQTPEKIILHIGAEATQAGDLGIIRLQGIVWDEQPEAMLEVMGKGQAVSIGSRVGIYNVISIKEGSVCLKR